MVDITVRGAHTAYLPPERGTVHARVGIEGKAPEPVYEQAAASARALADDLKRLHDPEAGPVTWWSSGQLRTWAQRPWNQDGKRLPLVHHAEVTFTGKFRDFEALSAWVGRSAEVPGVRVDNIEWTLTEATRLSVNRAVRARAVAEAKDRAQAYADALDLGQVRVVALADAGMLGEGLTPGGGGPVAFARAAGGHDGGRPRLEFVPDDIAVSAEVDGRFTVG